MVEKTARFLIRFRVPFLLLVLVLVGWAASGGRFLVFTNDYRVFFSKENPQLVAFETLQNTYTKNDNVLFVIAPKDGKVFTRKTLAAVERLTKAAWQVPYSIRVDSLTNFQYTHAEGDDLVVEDLVEGAEDLSDADLERIRSVAMAEPLLLRRLISDKEDVTGVNVTIQLPGKDSQREVPKVAAYVRKLAEQVRQEDPNLDVYLTGIIMMDNMFSEAGQHDLKTLVPVMFGVIILALGFLLRSFWGIFATVTVIAFSILTAMGIAGWMGIQLTSASVTAPTIILTLAVADCVHILAIFLREMRRGSEKIEALVESMRVNSHPVFLTSLTTIIGFLSMNFSDAPPFRDLGNMVAMGTAAAWFYSVSFFPALLSILPFRVRPGRSRSGLVMDRFGDFVVREQKKIFWGMLILIVGLTALIPRNELNDEYVKYFDESIPFRRATDFATAHLTGIYSIHYSLNAGEAGGVSNPAFLEKVDEFARWCRSQPEVIHVNTITDIMKRLNKNLHGDDPAWYRIPRQRDLSAQYLLLYEMSLPYGLDLNNQINVDKSATRFVVTVHSLSTIQMLDFEKRVENWLAEHAPPSMQGHGASPSLMFSHIGARNIRSMLKGTILALVLISGVLVFALKSSRIGLISLVPNLAPAGMAFGFWGVINGKVGLGLSVVVGMTLGIVVDDTIHFLSKYLRARREEGKSPTDAVRYAFSSVGMALWVTSLVLILGFWVLSLSAFEINAGMGRLTAITIALALAADFLFLPPLLIKLEE